MKTFWDDKWIRNREDMDNVYIHLLMRSGMEILRKWKRYGIERKRERERENNGSNKLVLEMVCTGKVM